MTNQEHFCRLEKICIFPINQIFQPEITISEGHAEISIHLKQDYHHAAHALHGAIYFKMLDDASFFAANSIEHDTIALTTNFTLHFLKPVSEGKLISKGELHFSSKNLLIADALLYNEKGEKIAYGTGIS
jgi:uncharacterized protein (TIGR00369 family)